MTNWIKKAKSFLVYFWGTHDDKYIVNEDGKKIVFLDRSFKQKDKNITNWQNKNKS